jgi:diguanylate cyclase (GGDEF)-like protein
VTIVHPTSARLGGPDANAVLVEASASTDLPSVEFFGESPESARPARAVGLAGVLLVSGAAAVVTAFALDLRDVPSPASGVRIPLALLAVGFFIGARYSLRERIGGTVHVVAATEVPLVLAVFSSRPLEVLVTGAVGMLLAVAVTRPQIRLERLRSVAISIAEIAIVLEVLGRIEPDPFVLRTATWSAVLATVLAVRFARLAVVHLIGVVTHENVPLRSLSATTLVAMASCLCFTSMALVAAMVQTQSRLAVFLVLVSCAVPIFAYRAYVMMRERFSRLRLLQEYTSSLSRSAGDQQLTSERAAEQARLLLNAETGEITLSRGEIAVRAISGDESRGIGVPVPGDWLWERIVATKRAVVVNAATVGDDAQNYRREVGARDILAAPLMHGEEVLGVLTVRNRPDELPTFSPSDCQLFATMADQTAVAVQASRLQERVQEELRAKARAAFVDPLTSLVSRHGLNIAIDEFATNRRAALLSLDLNGFKEINSTLGHDLGDDVLVLLAERIRSVLPRTATVARLGGDEFAVFVPDVDESIALVIANRVLTSVRTSAALDAATVTLDAAVGVALIPDHGRGHAIVMRRADLAMFEAKARGETMPKVFIPDMETQSHRRVELLRELRAALASGSLAVHYQPKARLDSGIVEGVEALVRWHHPLLGNIAPDEFIGLAEQSGLIEPLTEFVLRTALADCKSWRDRGLQASVGVNVSVQTLKRPDLLAWVEEQLTTAHVEPSGLVFELTEREYVDDDPDVARALSDLNALGVGLSIDDFGSGYSSLGYLRRLIADELKLDRALVKDVAIDEDAAAIVTAVVTLADQLGLTTVAEGVEDEKTWARLNELGVSVGQGYVLSRPLAIDALHGWLWERRNVAAFAAGGR